MYLSPKIPFFSQRYKTIHWWNSLLTELDSLVLYWTADPFYFIGNLAMVCIYVCVYVYIRHGAITQQKYNHNYFELLGLQLQLQCM